MHRIIFIFTIAILISSDLQSQHIGVNTPAPSQPLEVGGIIFTNQGGVMFPDSTVQTTAAAPTDPANAADTGRIYAVMTVSGIMGPFVEPPYQGTFRIFDLACDLSVSGDPFGSGGGVTQMQLNTFSVLTDVGRGMVPLFQKISEGSIIADIEILLLDSAMQPYFRFGLVQVYVNQMTPEVIYTGNDEYAHVYRLGFLMEILEMEDLDNSQFFAWNFATNSEP